MDNLAIAEPNVIYIINGLNLGGSETMLVNVIKYGCQISRSKTTVITLGKGDYFVPELQQLGVKVVELPLQRSPLNAIRQLFFMAGKADTISSWSYHTHLLTSLLKMRYKFRLTWFIRHADVRRSNNKLATWFIMRICGALSPICNAIAFNGDKSQIAHQGIGFRGTHMHVLPNGCDTEIYSPYVTSPETLADHIPQGDEKPTIVLSAARWHPIKDHPTFISAFAKAKSMSKTPLVAVLCGRGINEENSDLRSLLEQEQLQIDRDVFLLDQRDDLPRIMSGSDVYVMHSASEAFPNTLVQAMSSGLRVVSTDVGTAKQLSCGAFKLVEPGNYHVLALEILKQVEETKPQLDMNGRNLRQIIVADYSIASVIPQYEDVILGTP